MNCPVCGEEARAGAQYCIQCGAELLPPVPVVGPTRQLARRGWKLDPLVLTLVGGFLFLLAVISWRFRLYVPLLRVPPAFWAGAAVALLVLALLIWWTRRPR